MTKKKPVDLPPFIDGTFRVMASGKRRLRGIPVTMTPEVRTVLSCRSMRNKIGVPVEGRFCPPVYRLTVAHLVARGLMVWLDRARGVAGLPCEMDIYLLTPKGVAFCDQHGIEQR